MVGFTSNPAYRLTRMEAREMRGSAHVRLNEAPDFGVIFDRSSIFRGRLVFLGFSLDLLCRHLLGHVKSGGGGD
jgi:hypothetical protein